MCSDVRKHARCHVCGELEREVKGERTERSPPTGRAQKPNDEERYVRQRCCRTCKRIGSNASTYGSASTASPRARKTRQGCEKSRQRACSEISNPRNVIRLARWAGKERTKALAPLARTVRKRPQCSYAAQSSETATNGTAGLFLRFIVPLSGLLLDLRLV